MHYITYLKQQCGHKVLLVIAYMITFVYWLQMKDYYTLMKNCKYKFQMLEFTSTFSSAPLLTPQITFSCIILYYYNNLCQNFQYGT